MPRYRVCVTVDIMPYQHETFVTADDADQASELAVLEAERLINGASLDTSYDAWQCEECDEEDEARMRAENTDDEDTEVKA